MKYSDLPRAWGRILRGYTPFLSIEITKECPLHCPGCYAYSPEHLGPLTTLRKLSDHRGDDLVNAVLAVVERVRPIHLSTIGGEPLVRYRELGELLPRLDSMAVEVQLVTSAVRRIPREWSTFRCLHLSVSIDGLAPEHDKRRTPATYERIRIDIEGHRIAVHCTVTRPMVTRSGYLADFARFWSARPETHRIWFSIYTPQEGDDSEERLRPRDREALFEELGAISAAFPKVHLPPKVLEAYRRPPQSPEQYTFARLTTCLSADFKTSVAPCQLGGKPVCAECGCMASAGMHAVSSARIGFIPLSAILNASMRVGGTTSGWNAPRRRCAPV